MSDRHPTIDDAKALSYRYRKTGVLILHVSASGQFGTASYGMTRAQCRAMKDVSDQLHALIASGRLRIHDDLLETAEREGGGLETNRTAPNARDESADPQLYMGGLPR